MKVHFDKALLKLEGLLEDNTLRCGKAVASAVHAMSMGDLDEARKVRLNDAAIDVAENQIEEECLEILALYQPVAGDLRWVVTILKANGEIERAGDLAVNIARAAEDADGVDARQIWDFSEISGKAVEMFSRALDALMNHDAMAARQIIADDAVVDELHAANRRRAAECLADDPAAARYYLAALTVSYALERLGDLATNIAEDVIYLETAEIVRHR